ncbi:beta-N-acetylglucosaminidase [Desulfocucumis palustris]|uniref:Beta-N-acetylglucosaminidase n=1 Tax=Desulfocucumis palustris TaxID=1898651 RepID=A0A2L2XF37_9FIRM|nr:DUF4157 domain-containing protein [Desulfocucumis palustris]GBF34969.1 beta-N-acetylglucosaminidase [Desulfocucumis palustris]
MRSQIDKNNKEPNKNQMPQTKAPGNILTQQMNPSAIIQRAENTPELLSPQNILQLQQAIGNQASIRLLSGMVQRQSENEKGNEAIIQNAKEGLHSPSSALPYEGQIQKSFGQHDISQIHAHIGPKATESASAINALAYATGNHVVFAGRPNLHTVAHEVAHVVQQRHGVYLQGGVGKTGDIYEQQADAVARRVTKGQSAEDLLASCPQEIIDTSSNVIQRIYIKRGTKYEWSEQVPTSGYVKTSERYNDGSHGEDDVYVLPEEIIEKDNGKEKEEEKITEIKKEEEIKIDEEKRGKLYKCIDFLYEKFQNQSTEKATQIIYQWLRKTGETRSITWNEAVNVLPYSLDKLGSSDIDSFLLMLTAFDDKEIEELFPLVSDLYKVMVEVLNNQDDIKMKTDYTDFFYGEMIRANTAFEKIKKGEFEGGGADIKFILKLIIGYEKEFGTEAEWNFGDEYFSKELAVRARGFYKLLADLAEAVINLPKSERKKLNEKFIEDLLGYQQFQCHNNCVKKLKSYM